MLEAKYVDIYGAKMHYTEAGEGDPILFLHGVPTSSYLWRNVVPHLTSLGKCIAVDLIGFGQSAKPNIDYTISDHIKYIEKFIEVLDLHKITFVMHGWGSVIGFDYAMRHENNCQGLVFYEAFLHSLRNIDLSLPFQEQLIDLETLEHTTDITTHTDMFIDRMIQQVVIRRLTNEEMQNYRQPFMQQGASKPVLRYLQELSGPKEQAVLNKLITNYSDKLCKSKLSKLMLYSIPGFITTMATVIWAKEHLPNLEIVDIGEEMHLAQETCPQLIGETISVWLQGVEQAS
jgi:haloalkane dehalogenase